MTWKWLNLTLVFLLELLALVSLGYWGWHAVDGRALQILAVDRVPEIGRAHV